ncbi:augurin isoform X2 [Pseudopipra pipra]|uniref:augurin isoform X2 n=1 Tax=Pseudopipra pipra TaxID=415032 RepID=UPI003139DDDD
MNRCRVFSILAGLITCNTKNRRCWQVAEHTGGCLVLPKRISLHLQARDAQSHGSPRNSTRRRGAAGARSAASGPALPSPALPPPRPSSWRRAPSLRFGSSVPASISILSVSSRTDVSRGNKLKLMLQKREAPVAAKPEVSVKEMAAKEFLSSLRRQRRQLWDRSQPDVQQWYQQFLYLGFDEAKFEDDISYWTNLGRARNEYYGGYYQHHYDEDSPIGPRDPHSFRHGAGVNYDDY